MLRTSATFSGFVILMSVATPAAAQPACTTNYYRFEEGAANAAASGTGTLIDSVGGAGGGTPSGGPIYRADVLTPVVQNTGAPNTLALEFNGTQSALFPSLFIFHQGYADATLEFFIKVPDQSHRPILWTRPEAIDANRFHLAVNSGGGIGLDYRTPSGTIRITGGSHNSLFFVPLNTWTHVAVVRDTQIAAPNHVYAFYMNGVLQTTRTDVNPELPTVSGWKITESGLGVHPLLIGSIDEIRFSDCALTPDQFLISGCYPNCDGSTTAPVLNVADFICFMNKYAAGDVYANCDGSTLAPTLNVADFICFMNKYAAGCP